eukprot:NODE_116_length_18347_cov_2.280962.p18 type:complete len:108 gc:universal NODE_116_length_18347_cov_2.280962:9654-9331(-)
MLSLFLVIFLSSGLKVKRDEFGDYVPVVLPLDAVYIAEANPEDILTVKSDDSSIETLIRKSEPFAKQNVSDAEVGISEAQTSEDDELNRFLAWTNCGQGLLAEYFLN